MSKIKSKKQFKEQIDVAFETMKTRDEANLNHEHEAQAKGCLRVRGESSSSRLDMNPLRFA